MEAERPAWHDMGMTYHVEIIELSDPTDDGFLSQRLSGAYPTLDAARAALMPILEGETPISAG